MTSPSDGSTQRDVAPAVTLANVTKSYVGRTVIRNLSLGVAAGEFLAILGPSGSGKTTALRVIAGFGIPDSGKVFIGGKDVTADPAERRSVNTVFQSYALFPHMNVLENIEYGPRLAGVSTGERRKHALALLDLMQLSQAARHKPAQLSGGMQQRVALARALINEPQVLLLDEPLGALDRTLREDMQRELRRIQKDRGATFIYVTHDQAEAFGMADRLAVMREGEFIQVGTPAELYDTPASVWVAQFLGSANLIPVTRTAEGVLLSKAGPIAPGYVAPDVNDHEPAMAVVRPEDVLVEPADERNPVPNRFAATVVESLALGGYQRIRAITSHGLTFEALLSRRAIEHAPQPGEAVAVSFAAAAVRAYPIHSRSKDEEVP
ncbi:MAG: ABC transporter ATP-binding protein [Pseudomonadota bacterium]